MFCLSAFPAPLWFLARVLASFVVVLVLEFFAKRRQHIVSATEASEVGGGSWVGWDGGFHHRLYVFLFCSVLAVVFVLF